MADDKRKDPFVAVSTAVIVLAALGVTFFKIPLKTLRPAPELRESAEPERVRSRLWQDPFTTVLEHIQSQPKTPGSSDAKKSDKSLEAIWPCRLEHTDGKLDLLRHLKSKPAKEHFANYDPLLKQLYNYIYDKEQKVTVLGVMMPGSPYAEEIEARIRERVAVLSALGRLGYVPEDAEHLNFFRIQIKDTCREPQLLSDFIPYEWLQKPSPGHTRKVLLLWLNEDLFLKHPLFNILKFKEYFHLIDSLVPKKNLPLLLPLKVIGPASSGVLAEMIAELPESEAASTSLEIYSPAATAPNYRLLPGLIIRRDTSPTLEKIKGEVKKFSEKNGLKFEDQETDLLKLDQHLGKAFEKAFQDKNITFRRTITSDAALADTLVTELENRQVNLLRQKRRYHEWLPGWLWKHDHKNEAVPRGGHSDHVVLISEWDTLYGRALPETFLRVLRQRHNAGLEPTNQSYLHDDAEVNWVYKYSYLRGLDGITHSAKDKKESRSRDGGDKDSKDKEKLGLEEPVGSSQYDYLRRLADKIYLKHQQLLLSGQGAIRAVGIVGNDFYDKYLVLQALKQRLPEAIYFTTDLDARFLHESYQKYTRNLVVASSFALELPTDIQGAVPPFRTSYQTSAFYAVLRAVGDQEVKSGDEPQQTLYASLRKLEPSDQPESPGRSETGSASENKDKLGARLFEIGSQTAVILNQKQESRWSDGKKRIMVVILALTVLFLFLVSPNLKTWVTKHSGFCLGAFLTLLAAGVIYNYCIFRNPAEEPFRLFEGVSIWPTEVIRLVALACSWVFYLNARERLKESDAYIAERFNLSGSPKLAGSQELPGEFSQQTEFQAKDDKGEHVPVDLLWQDYQDQKTHQVRRVFGITFLFQFLMFLIISFQGLPTSPLRGDWSWWANFIIIQSTVFSFLFLTFYVFDTTRLLRRFLVTAEGKRPFWRSKSIKTFLGESNLEGEDLDHWLFIRLITRRTEVVNRLIFYPMIVWLFLFAAIQPYFDNWSFTLGLVVVISASALVSWLCALLLNRTAEKWRVKVLERLQREKIRLQSTPAENDAQQKRVESIINEIKNLQEGAFLPFFRHPVVQAFLVPFTGVGGLTLLEYLAKLP